MQPESIALFYQYGSSDKVYQVQLKELKGGWVVNFQYGRRGSSLVGGTKTADPVSYGMAKRKYDTLIRQKRGKGYTPGEGEVPYMHSEDIGEVTGFVPQLLTQVTEEQALALYDNYDIWLQIKHDGERRGVLCSPDEFLGSNRKGLKTPLAKSITEDLARFYGASRMSEILDTEDMGDYVVIFDILASMEDTAVFRQRADALKTFRSQAHALRLTNLIVDEPYQPPSKGDMLTFIIDARNAGEEGVVIRDGNSVYTPGKPNSGGPAWKLKFYEDATCRVSSRHPTKRSVSLELWDKQARKAGWIHVGNCAIPANKPIPDPGDLVEIRYLYAYEGGSLYQPQFKGVRTDVDVSAAETSQLKYKS